MKLNNLLILATMEQFNSTIEENIIIPQYSTMLQAGFTINEYSMNENFSEYMKIPNRKIYVNSTDDIIIQICLFLTLINFNEIVRYIIDATFGMIYHFNNEIEMQEDNNEAVVEITRQDKSRSIDTESPHSSNKDITNKLGKEYNPDSLISTSNCLGRIPERGDIITFTEKDGTINYYSDDEESQSQRCISTYSKKYIQPKPGYIDDDGNTQEGELYVVVHVNSEIPNRRSEHKKDRNGETFLHVTPISETNKNLYEESLRIFWFIDFNDLVIREHVSGEVRGIIDTLTIIGHDDRFNTDYESESCYEDSLSENDEWNDGIELTASIPEPNLDYQEYLYERAKYGTSDDEFTEYKDYYPESAYVRPQYYGGDPNFNDGDY